MAVSGQGLAEVCSIGSVKVLPSSAVPTRATCRHPVRSSVPRLSLTICRQDGVVLAWRSADPELVVQEVGSTIAGRYIVDVSAGKYRTAVVTADGDIFMWEGWSKPLEAGAASSRGSGFKETAAPPSAVMGKSPDAPRCVSHCCPHPAWMPSKRCYSQQLLGLRHLPYARHHWTY